MGTRSSIAKQNEDGTYTAIYCHWDGYPDHNGRILLNHYNDLNKINQLLALGDISSLGPEIGKQVSFDNPPDNHNQCIAYGRDRGETNIEAKTFKTYDEVKNHYSWGDYNYLFQDGVWTVTDSDGTKSLVDVLIEPKEEYNTQATLSGEQ